MNLWTIAVFEFQRYFKWKQGDRQYWPDAAVFSGDERLATVKNLAGQ